MKDDDWVTVVPGEEGAAAVARTLLLLAESPAHVRTDGNGLEFRVPPYLAALFNPATPAIAPAPKRRRSKKEEVTDDGS